mmetsp:Transcript_5975/g.18288  ORF Transcript_5975/g.18288 Transcript_5975/m.18288 type:complete len:88 (-) Transcript_5975:91-354(-)
MCRYVVQSKCTVVGCFADSGAILQEDFHHIKMPSMTRNMKWSPSVRVFEIDFGTPMNQVLNNSSVWKIRCQMQQRPSSIVDFNDGLH